MAAAARWCSKPGRGGSEPAPEVRGEADGHGGQRRQPCEARLDDRFDPDVVRWPAREDVGPVEHLGRKCPRAVDADAQQRLALRQRQQSLPIGDPPGDELPGASANSALFRSAMRPETLGTATTTTATAMRTAASKRVATRRSAITSPMTRPAHALRPPVAISSTHPSPTIASTALRAAPRSIGSSTRPRAMTNAR